MRGGRVSGRASRTSPAVNRSVRAGAPSPRCPARSTRHRPRGSDSAGPRPRRGCPSRTVVQQDRRLKIHVGVASARCGLPSGSGRAGPLQRSCRPGYRPCPLPGRLRCRPRIWRPEAHLLVATTSRRQNVSVCIAELNGYGNGRRSVAERSSTNTQSDPDHAADVGVGAAPTCRRLALAGAGRLASDPVMAVHVPSDRSGWNRSDGGWSSRSGTCALCGRGLEQSPAVLEARLPGRTVRVCGARCRGPHGSSRHIIESRSAREINCVADRLDVVYADLSNAAERGDIPFSEALPILLRIVGEQCVLWRVDEASAAAADG
jgi:hypothetical protein